MAQSILSNFPLLRRLIPSIRKRVARLSSTRGFSLRRSGTAALLLNTDNYVDRQIAFYGDYEATQQAWLFARMRANGCDVFLDVGANIGLYSIRVALAGLAPVILAFEPDPRNRLQMGANILLNRLTGRIRVLEQAVSAGSGRIGFAPAEETSTGKSRVSDVPNIGEVATVSLDDALDLAGQTVFVKMDIEGHELAACRGMARLAGQNRVLLQVECFSANLAELAELLGGMGLRPVHRIDNDHYFANFFLA